MCDDDLHQVYDQGEERKNPEASQVFIAGGLRAALNTTGAMRDRVINDVCSVLGCTPEALTFLFDESAVEENLNQIFDFPDSERRRQALEARNLSPAE